MRVLICGGRDTRLTLDDWKALDQLRLSLPITEVVSGCARGVDSDAIAWARNRGVAVKGFPADWDKHGRRAGPLRNQQMADYIAPDGVVLAWPGGSGTDDMCRRAAGMGLWVFRVKGH
jgi:predicted Rossmann fold nucleotide-binding protein DprA/Smf involved in DNA uptake